MRLLIEVHRSDSHSFAADYVRYMRLRDAPAHTLSTLEELTDVIRKWVTCACVAEPTYLAVSYLGTFIL